jgi:hypothetical protein
MISRKLFNFANDRLGGPILLLDENEMKRQRKALSKASKFLDATNPRHAGALQSIIEINDAMRHLERVAASVGETLRTALVRAEKFRPKKK